VRPDWASFSAVAHGPGEAPLPDGSSELTSSDGHDALLEAVQRQSWPLTNGDGSPLEHPLPPAHDLIDHRRTIAVWPNEHVQINLFFNDPWVVLFDIDLRRMREQGDLDALCAFVELLGSVTDHCVELSQEGTDAEVFLRYDPVTGEHQLLTLQ
jgi:hypothetical protein